LIVISDFLNNFFAFLIKPFDGTNDEPFQQRFHFNNFCPFIVDLKLQNISLLLLQDFNDQSKQSLLIELSGDYSQE